MPNFEFLTDFRLVRDIKAYIHLKAGLTQGETPTPSSPESQHEDTVRHTPQGVEREPGAEEAQTSEPADVFFIVGHGKSGTTWLARLLGTHPEILCLWEGRLFNKDWHREDLEEMEARIPPRSLYGALANSKDLRLWMQRSVWGRNEDPEKHLSNLTRLAVDYFLKQRLRESGKKIVGDKTPFLRGLNVIEEIADIYPEARVFHIIRDGRDTEVSWTHHRWNRATDRGGIQRLRLGEAERRDAYDENPQKALEDGIFDEEELRGRAAAWQKVVGKSRRDGQELLGDNYFEVRYEDLLDYPERETRRLLKALGARAGRKVVRQCVEQASFEKMSNGRQRGEEDASSLLRKGVAGDWRNAFTQRDKEIFKEEAGGLLVELGYKSGYDW